MNKFYNHLNLDERRKIYFWREEKVSINKIAKRLGRNRSTIFKEIRKFFTIIFKNFIIPLNQVKHNRYDLRYSNASLGLRYIDSSISLLVNALLVQAGKTKALNYFTFVLRGADAGFIRGCTALSHCPKEHFESRLYHRAFCWAREPYTDRFIADFILICFCLKQARLLDSVQKTRLFYGSRCIRSIPRLGNLHAHGLTLHGMNKFSHFKNSHKTKSRNKSTEILNDKGLLSDAGKLNIGRAAKYNNSPAS